MALIVVTATLAMLALQAQATTTERYREVQVYESVNESTITCEIGETIVIGKLRLFDSNEENVSYSSTWKRLYSNSSKTLQHQAPSNKINSLEIRLSFFCEGKHSFVQLAGCDKTVKIEEIEQNGQTKWHNRALDCHAYRDSRVLINSFEKDVDQLNCKGRCKCKFCRSNSTIKNRRLHLRIGSLKTGGNFNSESPVTLSTTVVTYPRRSLSSTTDECAEGHLPTVVMLKLNKTGDLDVNVHEELIHGDENLLFYEADVINMCTYRFFELQMTLLNNANMTKMSTKLPIPKSFLSENWTSLKFTFRESSVNSEVNVTLFFRLICNDNHTGPYCQKPQTETVSKGAHCRNNQHGPQCEYEKLCHGCLGCKLVLSNNITTSYQRVCDCRSEICETLTLQNVNQTLKTAPCDCKIDSLDGKSYGYYAVFASLLHWQYKHPVEQFNKSYFFADASFCVDGLCKRMVSMNSSLSDSAVLVYERKYSYLLDFMNLTLGIVSNATYTNYDAKSSDRAANLVYNFSDSVVVPKHSSKPLKLTYTVKDVEFEVHVYLRCATGYTGDTCMDLCEPFVCREGAVCQESDETLFNCWPQALHDCKQRHCYGKTKGVTCNKLCSNNGICELKPFNIHHCKCKEGYTGEFCESNKTNQKLVTQPWQQKQQQNRKTDNEAINRTKLEECYNEAGKKTYGCKNGGECERNPISLKTECVCTADFYGPQCTMQCSAYCLNGATCAKLGSGEIECLCTPLYTGVQCEMESRQQPAKKSSFLAYSVIALLTVMVSLGVLCVVISVAHRRSNKQTSIEADTVYVPIFAVAEKPYTTLRAIGMKSVSNKFSSDQRRSSVLENSKLGGFGASKASNSATTLGSQQRSRKWTFPNLSGRQSGSFSAVEAVNL